MAHKSDSLTLISPACSPYVRNATTVSPAAQKVFTRFRDLELDAYLQRTPYATEIMRLFSEEGGTIVNDHVALRTFSDSEQASGREVLEKVFTSFGYKPENPITIAPLHLECKWYEPPQDTNWPKVFISEQQVDQLPIEAQKIVYNTIGDYYRSNPFGFLVDGSPETTDPQALFAALETPPWNMSSSEYDALLELISAHPDFANALQYTAWTLVNAHRWNHFTILLNALELPALKTLEDLNAYVKEKGYPMNKWGEREIQGTAEKHLKQSSTIANKCTHTFSDGVTRELPGSFVEFIERFMVDGQPMRGFLGENAQAIFLSTNVK